MKHLVLKISEELPHEPRPVFELGIDAEPREDYEYTESYSETISLPRKQYSPSEAIARYLALVRARDLIVVGNVFTTERYYCLRVRSKHV